MAERAGISKGGLVYTFATKDALVLAILEREIARFQDAVRRRLGDAQADPVEWALAYIDEALGEDDATTQKAAFLVTALVHAPEMLEPVRRHYDALLEPLRSNRAPVGEVRQALLAVEGAFLLRGFGLADLTEDEHQSILRHARKSVVAASGKSTARRSVKPQGQS
ncbi:TetR/AcrR family transcriptional regulator [Pandoraea vervacti]|uniref:TetR/AcrR family transcriptional regulator n=1 Tax=Pandoraea vervacti TaxID=656178 RepID=UPI001F34391F|nr:TetR/AcrR family transcriptional regulator [Pandoraea vervacti]